MRTSQRHLCCTIDGEGKPDGHISPPNLPIPRLRPRLLQIVRPFSLFVCAIHHKPTTAAGAIPFPIAVCFGFARISLITAGDLPMVMLFLVHISTWYSHQSGITEFILQ